MKILKKTNEDTTKEEENPEYNIGWARSRSPRKRKISRSQKKGRESWKWNNILKKAQDL